MSLNTVYLDARYRTSLEHVAHEAGWVSHDLDGDAITTRILSRNDLRRKTLLLITLFESVDSTHSDYDLQRLVAEGIVSGDATMVSGSGGVPYDDQSQRRRLCTETARRIVTTDSVRIAREYVRSSDYRTGPSFSESRLAAACTEMMEDFYSDGAHFNFITHSNELHDFATYVESRFANIEECLYYSTANGLPFASQLCVDTSFSLATTRPVDDVYYIAKTRLQDEILVLPEPHDLNDVLRMRNAKEMARFRQVLTEWFASLHEGSATAEHRMRCDVAKANRELTRLSKWKQWKESPLNFIVNAVGGHIPILSNVLTVITMAGGMYEYRFERNHNWVMLGQR